MTTRIAILGGGISGLTAAYDLELARRRGAPLDWQLFEASPRLGGIVETTRRETAEGTFILEDGPDGWVSEKPWLRDLAVELGLEDQLIPCNERTRKTYISIYGDLQPIPDRMRMMVPEDLRTLETSSLFSPAAREAYAAELTRASELKASAPSTDESVATFVRRHFGNEVLTRIAGPLLSGVFGGDVETLSVRAVMPPFVAMEREHGSLIAALQQRSMQRGNHPPEPIFSSLRSGMGTLIDALVAALPPDRLHLSTAARSLDHSPTAAWLLRLEPSAGCGCSTCGSGYQPFDHVLLATSLDTTRTLLSPLDPTAAALLPTDASSAALVALAWPAHSAAHFAIPPGFGFLVPPQPGPPEPTSSGPHLLAATFVDQKFPHRAPPGARILRAFFGTGAAEHFASSSDTELAQAALTQLRSILGPLPAPDPALTTIRRWPRSLPQYAVGHLDRMAQLDRRIEAHPRLHLLGNAFRGVGLPDLVRDARACAQRLAADL